MTRSRKVEKWLWMSPPLRWSLKMMPHWSGIAYKAAITSFMGKISKHDAQAPGGGFHWPLGACLPPSVAFVMDNT